MRDLPGVGVAPHDLDHATPHDEQRCAGAPFLADVFAVRVLPLVHDAGEARELAAIQVLEQADLRQELDEAAPSVRHDRVRPLEQRPRAPRRESGRRTRGRRRSSRISFSPDNVSLRSWPMLVRGGAVIVRRPRY